MALAIARAPARWQATLLLAVMLPFWTGFLMRINAWIGLLADDGWIVRTLGLGHLLYTDTAMYIGIVYTYCHSWCCRSMRECRGWIRP